MSKILDNGYIKLIETYGSDERIIEAARMSTSGGFDGWEKDAKLLAYLYKNEHMTPFEMAGMIIEVKAPIMVFREWQRHRTQSYNEMSARYVPLPNENYIPDRDDLVQRSLQAANSKNRQAQGSGVVIGEKRAQDWLEMLAAAYDMAETVYQVGLEWGVPKELARLPIGVGRYSRMRASANLRNWLGFLKLRMAPNAQKEIRVYADAVCDLIAEAFPRTRGLFIETRGY